MTDYKSEEIIIKFECPNCKKAVNKSFTYYCPEPRLGVDATSWCPHYGCHSRFTFLYKVERDESGEFQLKVHKFTAEDLETKFNQVC